MPLTEGFPRTRLKMRGDYPREVALEMPKCTRPPDGVEMSLKTESACSEKGYGIKREKEVSSLCADRDTRGGAEGVDEAVNAPQKGGLSDKPVELPGSIFPCLPPRPRQEMQWLLRQHCPNLLRILLFYNISQMFNRKGAPGAIHLEDHVHSIPSPGWS